MKAKCIFGFLACLASVVYLEQVVAEGNSGSAVPTWRSQMQSLSDNLTNAFPFLYSRSEFKKSANKEIVLGHLKKLLSVSHTLPTNLGEVVIGASPLLSGSRDGMSANFGKAIELFKAGKYDGSQALVHKSIHNCFACHTAHQIGVTFPTTNEEVRAIATPFVSEKAIVFGALRQFAGALDFIEGKGFSSINFRKVDEDPLVKIYLVVSLRVLQKHDRALAFIDRLKSKVGNATAGRALTTWANDIREWKRLSGAGDSTELVSWFGDRRAGSGKGDKVVASILESHYWHNRKSSVEKGGASDAEVFMRLGQAYKAIGLEPLNGLIGLYAQACLSAKPTPQVLSECRALSKDGDLAQ